jgi:hypothetical protein
MPIALKLTQEQYDAAGEALRAIYVRKDDGLYHLDLNADEVETTFAKPLKRALDEEKEERRRAKEQLRQREEFLASLGVEDPNALKDIVSKWKEAQDKELIDKGELDKLIAKREEEATRRMRDAFTREKDTLTAENTQLRTALHTELVVSRVMAGCAKYGVRPAAVPDVLERAAKVFKVNGEGKVAPLGPDGQVVRGEGGEPLSLDEWFVDLQKQAEHLFVSNSGGGASNPQAGGARTAGSLAGIRRSQLSRKQKSDLISEIGREAYEQLPL